jgi:hypothetical protein
MKIKFLIAFLLGILSNKCNQNMTLEKSLPFETREAFFTLISSGTKEGLSTIEVNLILPAETALEAKDINISGIYFRGKMIVLNERPNNEFKGAVSIRNLGLDESDHQVAPEETEASVDPFLKSLENQLAANEGILCYTESDKPRYFKLVLDNRPATSIRM